MKIAFVNPPYKQAFSRSSRWPEITKSGTMYFPIWLAYATGAAEKAGNEVFLLDAIAKKFDFDQTIQELENFKPDMIVVDSSTPSIKSDIKFIETYKAERPELKAVLVGTHPSALPYETMKMSSEIDFIAKHEYDYTIPELVEAIEGNRKMHSITGILYRDKEKIVVNKAREPIKNLDELPFVSEIYQRFLKIDDYRYALATHPMVQVMSSRGCPNLCSFCLYPQTMMGRKFRPRSANNFVKELVWIHKNLKPKEIFVEDDTFAVDRERVIEICDLIKEYDLNIKWSCNVRADVPLDVLKKMKQAGCRMVIVGYESGNQKILNTIRKGITIKMAEEFNDNAKEAGLKIFGCFMIGLPGETEETIEETYKHAERLSPDMVFFQQAVPFPGTEFYQWCKVNKYLIAKDWDEWLDKNGQLDCIVSYPDLSAKDICKIKDKLMIRYYTSRKQIMQTLTKNVSLSEMKRLGKAGAGYAKYLVKRRKK